MNRWYNLDVDLDTYVCNLFGVDVYFLDGVLIYLLSSLLWRTRRKEGERRLSPPFKLHRPFLYDTAGKTACQKRRKHTGHWTCC